MATLERINQLKNQGISENEIIRTLQNEGVSPREINDALSQSQIKHAVSNMEEGTANMQPSMMGGKLSESEGDYTPPPGLNNPGMAPPSPNAPLAPTPNNSSGEYVPQTPYNQPPQDQTYGNYDEYTAAPIAGDEYYPQDQQYDNYEGYGYDAAPNTDTSIEIAEQVFAEKIKKFQEQMSDLVEFKSLFETKVENIGERLKRIEKMFDQMQVSVIEKVGTYGRGLENLKKEIGMVEDSFSKIVGDIKHKTHSKHSKPSKKKSKK